MKKVLIYLCLMPLLVLVACDKEGLGDNYNFDNKVAPYVAFSSTAAVDAKEGATVVVPLTVRTAIQEELTITLSLSGAINREQTVVLPRGVLTVNSSITIPAGTIVSPATSATVTVALTKAVSSGGTEFTIGRLANPETQKKVLNITLP
ncbi:hypothetical protein [Sphingobacterium pedocola]|uniref:DUF1735 domain-containing protein n=1 Tax=Sphingobacterium pedocola TaxID=2082722 RepID=A0ABR9T2F4_9SPHI|nr:hypothetical protein [Sphingobacterium pedocola]MBE8719455.1 hypothetical protein [Sphingobacterium pedocola]